MFFVKIVDGKRFLAKHQKFGSFFERADYILFKRGHILFKGKNLHFIFVQIKLRAYRLGDFNIGTVFIPTVVTDGATNMQQDQNGQRNNTGTFAPRLVPMINYENSNGRCPGNQERNSIFANNGGELQ